VAFRLGAFLGNHDVEFIKGILPPIVIGARTFMLVLAATYPMVNAKVRYTPNLQTGEGSSNARYFMQVDWQGRFQLAQSRGRAIVMKGGGPRS
jgi:hypothetical protein